MKPSYDWSQYNGRNFTQHATVKDEPSRPTEPCVPCGPCKPCEPDNSCPNSTEVIPFKPCAECLAFNPNNPPPGWPDAMLPESARWANRGSLPPETRCNIQPQLISIDAKTAFEAYQNQTIGGKQGVLLLDVRTPDEVYWIGSPAQVNKITLKTGQVIVPDRYLATVGNSVGSSVTSPYIQYSVGPIQYNVACKDIASTNLTVMSYNIPVEFIDPTDGSSGLNPLFGKQVDALVNALKPKAIIWFCRSGLRSSIGCYYQYCPMALASPDITNYEVEGGSNGLGGFEGQSYSDTILGYRGYPNRVTAGSGMPLSVSFKDMALPIKVGKPPVTVCVDPKTGALKDLGVLEAVPWAYRAV